MQNDSIKRNSNCRVKSKISFNEENDLEVLFEKASITEKARKKHFDSDSFIIAESFQLPEFAVLALGKNYSIEVGKYLIIEKDLHYKVVFNKY